jgi:hypothetical protein
MQKYNLSFKITKPIAEQEQYIVDCDEMACSIWTSNPKTLIQSLVREWFELDLATETPDSYDEHRL